MAADPDNPQNQTTQGAGGNKPYVLIAEDAKFYAKVDQMQFEKAGFEVTIVSDGQQLIDTAKQRKPDIILLDLIMPVKDGFATIQELKADPNLKDIKVLVFSNLSQAADMERVKALGATDFLFKTELSPKVIAEKVRSYL